VLITSSRPVNGSVVAKLVMMQLYGPSPGKPASRHYKHNTVRGWTVWVAIIASVWALAFVIAEGASRSSLISREGRDEEEGEQRSHSSTTSWA
jgi:hypothetical protein